MVDELRLSMAGLGLPKGGNVGLELWNETKLGQTPVSESVNLTRALQGELERTIQAIDAVKAVRVGGDRIGQNQVSAGASHKWQVLPI